MTPLCVKYTLSLCASKFLLRLTNLKCNYNQYFYLIPHLPCCAAMDTSAFSKSSLALCCHLLEKITHYKLKISFVCYSFSLFICTYFLKTCFVLLELYPKSDRMWKTYCKIKLYSKQCYFMLKLCFVFR